MKFLIITQVSHTRNQEQYFGYAPYVREMNIWFKYVDEVIIVAPLIKKNLTTIDIAYSDQNINFRKVPDFNLISFKNILRSFFKMPIIVWEIFWAMKSADHIHLRCPGNIGLLGCFVQVFFPSKRKTAKYAGNWDPKSKQPWTYRLQKYILSNTFLSRNMQVLVYGDWENQSKNIKSFFTASYAEFEKEIVQKSEFGQILNFIFVGGLVSGKNPMYAIQLVEQLIKSGNQVVLDLYGEGSERSSLETYIQDNKLMKNIVLKGNQNQEIIKRAYQKSHFVILPSNSEGWPKAIAEGMFWGCVPIATKVSCVPFMIDYGKRGILLETNFDKDINKIEELLKDENVFTTKSKVAREWSQKYTTDIFENEIKKLLLK